MKRKIYFFIICIILQLILSTSAAMAITVETMYNDNSSPLISTADGNLPEFVQINGETYLGDSIKNSKMQVKYDTSENDILRQPGYDWDFDGEYYLRRVSSADDSPLRYRVKGMKFSIFDKDFNFIRESPTFGGYIKDFGYYDGTYYCVVEGEGYFTSTDLMNWTKQTEGFIYTDHVGNTAIRNMRDAAWNINSALSIQKSDFYNIAYETESSIYNTRHFGEWLLKEGRHSLYLTNDNVYGIQIVDSATLEGFDGGASGREYQIYMYEYGDEIIIERRYTVDSFSDLEFEIKGYRFRIPKQPVYDALEAQKNAPYVCVNNTILGFETPPVTEADRTLVPMRFLFEQLGAEVSWDEATETATAVKANTTINFAIDNATATVNGTATAMDVPARLVGDKTMVPLRFLSEQMGYTVEWDEETRMATITMPLTEKVAMQDTKQFETWIQ